MGGVASLFLGWDGLGAGVVTLHRVFLMSLLVVGRRLGLGLVQILSIVLAEGLRLGLGLRVLWRCLAVHSLGFSLLGGEVVLAVKALRWISNHVLSDGALQFNMATSNYVVCFGSVKSCNFTEAKMVLASQCSSGL